MGNQTLPKFALACAFSSLFFCSSAGAGNLVGPDLTLFQADYQQIEPAVAYNWRHDEFLVVWENEQTGGVHDIYARRVSGDGTVLSQFAISGGDGVSRFWPDVDYDSVEDRYLVVYAKEYLVDDNDIYGRFIPWQGPDANLTEFFISLANVHERTPHVAYGIGDSIGKQFLVVWNSDTTPESVNGTFVKGDGSGIGTAWRISPAAYDSDSPAVAYNSNRNEFMVVWSMTWGTTQDDIAGVILNASGTGLHGGWFAISTQVDDERSPVVAACPSTDQYLVVFESPASMNGAIHGRLIQGDSTMPGAVFEIQNSAIWELWPSVSCFNAAGLYLVTWTQQYYSDTGPGGIAARTVNKDGDNGKMISIVMPSATADTRRFADVASGSPNFFVAWEHRRDGTSYYDAHGSLVMPVVFADGFESGNTSKWSTVVN